ncbi:MAG: phosphoribosylformylglycinamidine synthase subunit PurL, partial [Armatimonadetes bacterium]|nr:phosphoribosylformylglycinamidine synthase subunit PurL [Armatimonadota bacterium]NIM24245.1 phosphoribosylformylglycinamidine synthase subunit PurL [Armatimonadota bacterium]NIM68114.1 phosphoribosylformylglycinamidine synthase subunit PurL [Armatimonadota bacterium]NIM76576.1 phosphoribosylformylglycinamidine synthase subunit PurL [Armatimonadota bacterium]NIN06319.1 phosphoribosylformylglycinamidine synthase subunit PurL [Armatimonadota bacterium]
MIDPRVYHELGLSDEEYQRILNALGREPTHAELAMFSVEWSEHCGYPRSRPLLGLLPREGKYPTRAKGEDAGGVEVAPGLYCLFKMESHNHPSQVEPKQGAATGIGGIIRDVFTMGARPVALMDSLRFGPLSDPHARYLLAGVVDGIQFYGNCLGVPTVGGEIEFNECYRGNCLVNVMAVGIAEENKIATSAARGKGNPVLVVGNSTGRDGIGGASILASHEFGENEEKRPTVQIGDPFTEKCLIEACLEVLETGAIVGLKDMGAAGVTCTTSEMSAAGGVGMDIELQRIPRREAGMEPWEMLMSESQERMLVVAEKGREDEVIGVFKKWGLNASIVGEVTDDGLLTIRDNGEVVASIDAAMLADPPTYHLPTEEPAYLRPLQETDLSSVPEPEDYAAVLMALLSSPNIASKAWAFRQYDHMIQTNTVVAPGEGDAAVLRIKGYKEGIGITTDGNGRYCYLDPYLGAQLVMAEAARNLVCVGADPAGITDCLNFGNPEKPDRFWQFSKCVEGIADACRTLGVAVVSGNVSFYNEGPDSAVYPTPVIGMVGVLRDVTRHCKMGFRSTGEEIFLLGRTEDDLGGSEYLKLCHGMEAGSPPKLDWELEKGVQQACLEMIQKGLLSTAHDCSQGGLAVTLAECCIAGGVGADITLPDTKGLRADTHLFGESPSRIV